MAEQIETKVKQTIQEYKLFTKQDRVAVAASGGKDSSSLLYILKHLGYNITAVTVDAHIGNYTAENLANLRAFCKEHGIKLVELSFREEFGGSLGHILSHLHSNGVKLNSCSVCGVLRRYIINKFARCNSFSIVATGHNMDDEAEATLMNIFRNDIARFARQGVIPGITWHEGFVQRVKPLYFCSELEITAFSKKHKLPVKYGRCPYASNAYRFHVRKFINAMEKLNKNVKHNTIGFVTEKAERLHNKFSFEIKHCKFCGEPTSTEICKTCQLISMINGDENARVSG